MQMLRPAVGLIGWIGDRAGSPPWRTDDAGCTEARALAHRRRRAWSARGARPGSTGGGQPRRSPSGGCWRGPCGICGPRRGWSRSSSLRRLFLASGAIAMRREVRTLSWHPPQAPSPRTESPLRLCRHPSASRSTEICIKDRVVWSSSGLSLSVSGYSIYTDFSLKMKARGSKARLAYSRNVAMVRATAAAEDAKIGQMRAQISVLST